MLISPTATAALTGLLTSFGQTLPPYLETPSPLFVFGILYFLFENLLWRWPPFRWVQLVKVPDLNGCWDGEIRTNDRNFEVPYRVRLEINQTWTRIRVRLITASSGSASTSASVEVESPQGAALAYEYLSEPEPNAPERMQMHRGTTRLILSSALSIW